jgi:hypothetical protein
MRCSLFQKPARMVSAAGKVERAAARSVIFMLFRKPLCARTAKIDM